MYVYLSLYTYIMIFLYIYFTVSQVISRTHSIFVQGHRLHLHQQNRAGPDSFQKQVDTSWSFYIVLHVQVKNKKTTSIEDINIVIFYNLYNLDINMNYLL